MEKLSALTAPLLTVETAVLEELLRLVEKYQSRQFKIALGYPPIQVEVNGEFQPFIEDKETELKAHKALEALVQLGFVAYEYDGQAYDLTILPSAIYRARHERRGAILRHAEVFVHRQGQIVGIYGFLISLVLAIIEILRTLGVLLEQ